MSDSIKSKDILPWIIMLIFFAVLNETVFSVATPAIQGTFGKTEAEVSWISTIFLITFGIGAVIFGKLADVINLRSLVTLGVFIYAGSSLLGFLVQGDFNLILLARGIQGFSCAAIPSLVFAVAGKYIAPEERGQSFGFITSFVAISIGIGPVLGGVVSAQLSWAWLFLVPLPILLALIPLRRILPKGKSQKPEIDLIGGILVSSSVGFLVYGVNRPEVFSLVGFLVSFGLLIPASLLIKNPFIPLDLFQNKKFTFSVLVGFLLFAVVMSSFFLLPQVLSRVHHLDTTQIGLFLFPGAIFPFFIGPLVGRLADKKGNYLVVMLGLSALVVGMSLLMILSGLSPWAILFTMVLVNAGFAFFQTGLMNSISQHLPEKEIGIGMGLFNLLSVISGAVGVAVVGSLLTGKVLAHPLWDFMAPSALYNNTFLLMTGVTVLGLLIYAPVFFKTRGPVETSVPHQGH